MNTILLDRPGHFCAVETDPPPAPGPKQATVRIRHVGICGTDYHAFGGRQPFFEYPRILGHELSGEVVRVGEEVTSVKPGDRVAIEPYLNCGECVACRRGKPNCCTRLAVFGVQTDGGMRELVTLPAHKLHPSGTLPLEQLAIVETLCIGAHAVERAGLAAGERVLVVGAGPIGLTVITFAGLAGADVTVMELNPQAARLLPRAPGHYPICGRRRWRCRPPRSDARQFAHRGVRRHGQRPVDGKRV